MPLLEASIGRIAADRVREILKRRGGRIKMGDLPASQPMPGLPEVIAGWFTSAIDADDEWLHDVDEKGRPERLMACQSYDDLLEQAQLDFDKRKWPLPGR
ncbi:hypothetical protein [Mesorhizobium sp. A623]